MSPEKLILRELDDSYSWMRTLGQFMIAWYSFFVTANVAILGWKFTKGTTINFPPLWFYFFYLLSIFGTLVVILTAIYFTTAERRNRSLISRLNQLGHLSPDLAMQPSFPLPFIQVGFFLMALGLLVLLVIWIMASRS